MDDGEGGEEDEGGGEEERGGDVRGVGGVFVHSPPFSHPLQRWQGIGPSTEKNTWENY